MWLLHIWQQHVIFSVVSLLSPYLVGKSGTVLRISFVVLDNWELVVVELFESPFSQSTLRLHKITWSLKRLVGNGTETLGRWSFAGHVTTLTNHTPTWRCNVKSARPIPHWLFSHFLVRTLHFSTTRSAPCVSPRRRFSTLVMFALRTFAPAICSTSQFRAEGFTPCSCSHLSWWKRCKLVARNQFLEQSKLSFLLQRPVKEQSLRWTLDF